MRAWRKNLATEHIDGLAMAREPAASSHDALELLHSLLEEADRRRGERRRGQERLVDGTDRFMTEDGRSGVNRRRTQRRGAGTAAEAVLRRLHRQDGRVDLSSLLSDESNAILGVEHLLALGLISLKGDSSGYYVELCGEDANQAGEAALGG